MRPSIRSLRSHSGRTVVALMCALAAPMAQASGLDDLLRQVREGQQAAARMNADREQRFLQNRDEQANLQKQAEAELAAAKARADGAKAKFEAGRKLLADLKDRINAKTGEDAQVYAAARQAAADFRAATSNSFVTAQFPDRIGFLDHIAQSQGVIAGSDLEQLWYVLQQDMTETSHSVKFDAEIIDADGVKQKAQVTRVGAFSAFSSTTANSGNSFASGTVVLADNDANAAMYQLTNQKPGVVTDRTALATPARSMSSIELAGDQRRSGSCRWKSGSTSLK